MRLFRFVAIPFVLAAALSASCEPVTLPPSAPEAPRSVTATAAGENRIDLAWSHSGESITRFIVQRRSGPASFGQVTDLPPDARAFADEGLSAGTPYEYRLQACASDRCSVFTSTAYATTNDPIGRFAVDAPDDIPGPQVHVMYVLPNDAIDRRLDLNGTLATSVASFHAWFMANSGLSIRFDTRDGVLDITGFRLAPRDEEIKATGDNVLYVIESELQAAGKLLGGKTYLVYYDGGSTYACGGAKWPGQITAMYLKGTPRGASCGAQPFAPSGSAFPGYWEFAALHDLHHTLGIVSPYAPNHQVEYPGHVPEPNDLMYTGPGGWVLNETTTIDVDANDYFGVGVPAEATRLTDSPLVSPIAAASLRVIAPPDSVAVARLQRQIRRLLPHEPLVRRTKRDEPH